MTVEILEDGTLKITTDKISMPNHTNAEGLIRDMVKAMGGTSTRVRRSHSHSHTHEHDEEHHHH